MSQAATMDMMLMDELFEACIAAARLLNMYTVLQQKWEQARNRLPSPRIGKYGQLQEWSEDFEYEDVHHRHVSHLYGIFPGSKLTKPDHSDLRDAARISLERRGDEGTGWSLAWKVGLRPCAGWKD